MQIVRGPRILPTQATLQPCNERSQDPPHTGYTPAMQIVRGPRILPTQATLQLCNEMSQDPPHTGYTPAMQIVRGPRILPTQATLQLCNETSQDHPHAGNTPALQIMRRPRILPTHRLHSSYVMRRPWSLPPGASPHTGYTHRYMKHSSHAKKRPSLGSSPHRLGCSS